MSNQTIKTTAYQIYIYLNFENKNEIHKPEAKHLNSEQESINKNMKSHCQFFFTVYFVFACCQHLSFKTLNKIYMPKLEL